MKRRLAQWWNRPTDPLEGAAWMYAAGFGWAVVMCVIAGIVTAIRG